MAPSLQLAIVIVVVLLASFCFSRATATGGHHHHPAFAVPTATSSPNPPATPFVSHDLHDSSFSPTTLFEPILTNLGFQELAMAVPSLSDDSAFTTWSGPSTLFAPTDASIRSCSTCSVTRLLREHIVPGLFSHDYLRKLAFGTKIETMDPGRCITVTSAVDANNSSKIYVGGVEITRPDLFNNGLVVVHGLQGYVAPLSPFSCNIERMTSLSFPFQPDQRNTQLSASQAPSYVMRLMLRDAMLRLRNSGFSVLSLAFKVKYAELVNLQNMTVFAVDDVSIFSGSHAYVSNIRFHIIPNRLLPVADLEKLPAGTSFPTLVAGQSLVVTTAGGISPMRINYVRIKVPDVMRNLKIVVHSVYLPFPHLHHAVSASASSTSAYEMIGGDGSLNFDRSTENNVNVTGSCTANPFDRDGDCADTVGPADDVKQPMAMFDMEDHRGLWKYPPDTCQIQVSNQTCHHHTNCAPSIALALGRLVVVWASFFPPQVF